MPASGCYGRVHIDSWCLSLNLGIVVGVAYIVWAVTGHTNLEKVWNLKLIIQSLEKLLILILI